MLVAGKYLAGEPATWGEGDWDGWKGPNQRGDGLFNQRDIVAALQRGWYLHSGCDFARRPLAASEVAWDVSVMDILVPDEHLAGVDPVSVPEPSMLSLLSVGVAFLVVRRQQCVGGSATHR